MLQTKLADSRRVDDEPAFRPSEYLGGCCGVLAFQNALGQRANAEVLVGNESVDHRGFANATLSHKDGCLLAQQIAKRFCRFIIGSGFDDGVSNRFIAVYEFSTRGIGGY